MRCVCSSHTWFHILTSHISDSAHWKGMKRWTINDALFCVCVWLWIARTFGKLCTQMGVHKKNGVLHMCTDTRTSHLNKIIFFGQQQIALSVARRNIIYATNRDILLYYYFVIQNPNHFLTLIFSLFSHWQFPIRFHWPMRRKFSLERIQKSNGEWLQLLQMNLLHYYLILYYYRSRELIRNAYSRFEMCRFFCVSITSYSVNT